jgi:hypothetical protein
MLHAEMARISVRVVPSSSRTAVEVGPEGVIVRVRAAPEMGRATEEARRALGRTLGVPPSRISLRTGGRSRMKVFEVEGVSGEELEMRIRAT